MQQVVIYLGSHPVTLSTRDFDDEVDVDQLLVVDHSNLYGEAVTIPALMNQIGILKASANESVAQHKLKLEVYEAELKQRIRKESNVTAQKITEGGLAEMVLMDPGYQIEKKNLIKSNFNLEIVESIWWSVKSKDQKLNNLVKGVTPEELFAELVDGTINNIVLKKKKSITEMK